MYANLLIPKIRWGGEGVGPAHIVIPQMGMHSQPRNRARCSAVGSKQVFATDENRWRLRAMKRYTVFRRNAGTSEPIAAKVAQIPPTYFAAFSVASDSIAALLSAIQSMDSTASRWNWRRRSLPNSESRGTKRKSCRCSWLRMNCTERAQNPQLPSYTSIGAFTAREFSAAGISGIASI